MGSIKVWLDRMRESEKQSECETEQERVGGAMWKVKSEWLVQLFHLVSQWRIEALPPHTSRSKYMRLWACVSACCVQYKIPFYLFDNGDYGLKFPFQFPFHNLSSIIVFHQKCIWMLLNAHYYLLMNIGTCSCSVSAWKEITASFEGNLLYFSLSSLNCWIEHMC